VHFKIYPFVYAASLFIWLGPRSISGSVAETLGHLLNRDRVVLAVSSFVTFMGLNAVMYNEYGAPFVEHSFTYHLTRIDHRHNFSIYNTVLHLSSAAGSPVPGAGLRIESVAFIPQLFLALILTPLLLAKKDLPSTMLAQTFAFVTFNKVCTSQVSRCARHLRSTRSLSF